MFVFQTYGVVIIKSKLFFQGFLFLIEFSWNLFFCLKNEYLE